MTSIKIIEINIKVMNCLKKIDFNYLFFCFLFNAVALQGWNEIIVSWQCFWYWTLKILFAGISFDKRQILSTNYDYWLLSYQLPISLTHSLTTLLLRVTASKWRAFLSTNVWLLMSSKYVATRTGSFATGCV